MKLKYIGIMLFCIIFITNLVSADDTGINYNPFYTTPTEINLENENEFIFELTNLTEYDLYIKSKSDFCVIDIDVIPANTTQLVHGMCTQTDTIYIYGIHKDKPIVKTKLKVIVNTTILPPPEPPIIIPEPVRTGGGRNLLKEGLEKYGESYFIILKELNKARKEYPDKIIHSFYWKNSRTYDITYAIENNSYKIIKSIKV